MRARRADERGMSLIEVAVALALLATGVLATASAMDGSARAVSAVDHRSRAVLLARTTIEQLRAIPYDALGLSASADGFQPTFEGRDTVIVAADRVRPGSEEPGTGIVYHVERDITWEDVTLSDATPVPGAAKRLTVIVSWPDGGSPVRLDSAVSPLRKGVECSQRWVDAGSAGLSGVINTYLAGVAPSAAGATTVQVAPGYRTGSGAPIAPGDLIMVIQMTGAGAGLYEYAIATSTPQGGVMGVTGPGPGGGLSNAYGSDGTFQVVRVPTYGDAAVQPGLVPLPFDGWTGGVLAMDVTGSLGLDAPIDADGTGLSELAPVRTTSPVRLVAGSGSPGAPGGGLVAIRAGSVSTGNDIHADGRPGASGGAGGTVVLALERGGLETTSVSARGAALSGAGGSLLSTAPPRSVAVDADPGATAGTVATTVDLDQLVGVRMGVGCEPAVTVSLATWTPTVTVGAGQPVVYQLVVEARGDRGGPVALAAASALPVGFTYRSTLSLGVKGDVVRPTVVDPTVGDAAPRWGSFWMAPGSAVVITFSVDVAALTPAGLTQTWATATYASGTGTWVGTYPGPSDQRDDVTVATAPPDVLGLLR